MTDLRDEVQGFGGGVVLQGRGLAAFEEVEDDVEVLLLEVVAFFLELADLFEVILGEFDLFGRAVDDQAVAPDGQAHAQAAFELLQVAVEDAEKDILPGKGVGDFFHLRGRETRRDPCAVIINTSRRALSN